MKKLLPFIFPLIALLIVLFLAYRWYSMNTPTTKGEISDFGEGVTIENLTQNPPTSLIKGSADMKTASLQGEGEATGEIRYEIKDSKVTFSVSADLPTSDKGGYQVWLKKVGGSNSQKAFNLIRGKGGYLGTAAIEASLLPVEVNVTSAGQSEAAAGTTILRGVITE